MINWFKSYSQNKKKREYHYELWIKEQEDEHCCKNEKIQNRQWIIKTTQD